MSQIVKPINIQSQLNAIWESLQTTKTTRACLFNLIFYTQKDHRTPYIQRIANSVIKKFPARVIFVTVDPHSKTDELSAEVSVIAASKGEYDVACDLIHLQASGLSQERIPFVVLPHILPDLPVYLAWAEDPCHDVPILSQLEHFADRLIFDSESTDNLSLFAKRLLKKHREIPIEIADLNWARIETWRDILSSTFYTLDRLDQIKKAETITITYNAQKTPFFAHTHIQAFYLQAWLACQLDWKFQKMQTDHNQFTLLYETPHTPLTIRILAVENDHLPPGLILSTEILNMEKERFCFERNLNLLEQITLHFSTPTQCAIPCKFLFSKVESGHSLVKEIYHRGTSEHFIKVLNLMSLIPC